MAGDASEREELLPSDALRGLRLGISVSDSADLARLGLLETHFRLALGEIARCVLVSGGQLTYGGHLDPDGYTVFLVQELYRYSRRDGPLHICLAWPEHRRIALSDLNQEATSLGLYGDITCLDVDGVPVDPVAGRGETPAPEEDNDARARSLTSLRRYMAENTEGRIFLGGKREGFQGALPGLVEEAVIALEHGQPVYLAGGFGGVTLDIVKALEVDDGAWLPALADAPAPDERLTAGLGRLADIRGRDGWQGLDNGLSDEENRKLAVTHRPSEIAALIGLGLGRRFAKAGDETTSAPA